MNGSLIVRCASQRLALPLAGVHEVFRMVAVATRMPRAPRHCLGVVDHHGRLVPLFDLVARLGLGRPRDEEALVDCHVVLLDEPGLARLGVPTAVGYVVDEVHELTEAPVEPLPIAHGNGQLARTAVRCTDGTLAPILDRGGVLTVLQRAELRVALETLRGRSAR